MYETLTYNNVMSHVWDSNFNVANNNKQRKKQTQFTKTKIREIAISDMHRCYVTSVSLDY